MSTHDDFAELILAAFAEQAAELLLRVENLLQRLLASPSDQEEVCLEIERTLHTLKGAALTVGSVELRDRTHALEEQARALRLGKTADGDALAPMFSGLNDLQQIARGLVGPPPAPPTTTPPRPPQPPEVVGAEAVEPRVAEAEAIAPEPTAPETTAPPAVEPEPSPRPQAGQTPAPHEDTARTAAPDLLRVRSEHIDALHNQVGELVVARLQFERIANRLNGFRKDVEETIRSWRVLTDDLVALQAIVPDARIQDLGEKSRLLGQQLGLLSREAFGVAREAAVVQGNAASVTSNLEDGIRDLRLIPLRVFFEQFAPVLRERADTVGRRARLEIRADGAEMDRAVLARLREPLLHLITNAVAHGLETPERRQAAGKPPVSIVRLEASSTGTRAVIRVVDDGAGIDVAAVTRRASKLGLLEGGRKLDDEALLEILAHPGFTTREAADTLAGRGIGLDVVASTIRSMDGQLWLENEPGRGCAFNLEVPITASTGQGLIVVLDGQQFGLLVNHIESIVNVRPDDIQSIEGLHTVAVQGEPVAVAPLASILGMQWPGLTDAGCFGIVLTMNRQRLVLLVDDIPDEQDMVIKPFGKALAGTNMYLGAAVQADGSVLPIVHVAACFERASGVRIADTRRAEPEAKAAAGVRAQDHWVLVVDDSISMRTMERNILTSAGYNVVVAHDGENALAELERMADCSLVVTDLQMPRMDGIELCRSIRAGRHANLPIIMVTSIDDAAQKRRALEAGADAYIIKSAFEKGAFVASVHRVLGVDA